jgi:hypothetical protein
MLKLSHHSGQFRKNSKLSQKGLAGTPVIPMFAAPKRGFGVSGETIHRYGINRTLS